MSHRQKGTPGSMGARTIQICGTGSGVGKSVIVAGLCRIFLQDGFKVAPFKAQNMSLNSFVTLEGGEIGRAQALQAAASGLKPSVDMNPILLKPSSDTGSQVIVRGKPVGNMSAMRYRNYKGRAGIEVLRSFNRLKNNFEVIVLEGAGSPAEVNLKSHDIVNMNMARAAEAPVVLVGDIDRGGVFAWLIGTFELLTKEERKMIKGFIINKFRGDKRLLRSGLDFLEQRTGVKVLGVIPYFRDIRIPEEDSVSLDLQSAAKNSPRKTGPIKIAVIKLSHISNFTDFDPLKNESDVNVSYISNKDELKNADLIIVPGTKNVFWDLAWLKKSGLADRILSAIRERPSTMLIGICGGYQMLGMTIRDSHHLESNEREISGLGMLPVVTIFEKEKILTQVKAKEMKSGLEVSGYEIHHGRTKIAKGSKPAFRIYERQGKAASGYDGAVSADGRIWGTYIHGVFDSDSFRRYLINRLRIEKGLRPTQGSSFVGLDREIDKLADVLRKNLDMSSVRKILFGKDR